MNANRTSRGTNFNATSAEHSGSSRSHAALILTLHQLEASSRDYVQTTFTLVDLAGAERPDKVRAEVKQKPGAVAGMTPEFLSSLIDARDKGSTTQKDIDKMVPLGFQTQVINFELFSLGSEVIKATDCNKKGTKWGSPMATPTIKFLSAILDGKAGYGDATLYCWVRSSHADWQLLFYYMPLMVAWIVCLVCVACVRHEINRRKRLPGVSQSRERAVGPSPRHFVAQLRLLSALMSTQGLC